MRRTRTLVMVAAVLGMIAVTLVPATAGASRKERPEPVRFATFNASLNRGNLGDLAAELAEPGSPQPANVAEIIQRNRPDVLLINEFDYDPAAVDLFQENYLGVSQNGEEPIHYPYVFIAPSNTGEPSGVDLDGDGTVGGPNDAYGFGFFPGQFGMLVLSQYPIVDRKIRTFQNFLWADMPDNLMPTDFYSQEAQEVFRLSSKSHWDVPIRIGGREVHFLVSHPTPPVFDDPVIDQNGRRNHDEIRFWADYIRPWNGRYIYDDEGRYGGMRPGAMFVIAGDQNADPFDGDSVDGAINQLLGDVLVNTRVTPSSPGGTEQAALQGGLNDTHLGDPAFDTADFNDAGPGNLRVDYVLPRRNLRIVGAGVDWPLSTDPAFAPVGVFDPATFSFPSSDHRLVYVDVVNKGFVR
ncbi:MAG: endonuclease/exonuclease/phosphatase family protein [Actinomycetota bacterium]